MDVLEELLDSLNVLDNLMSTSGPPGRIQKQLQGIVRTVKKRVEKPWVPRVIIRIEGGNFQGASSNMYVDLSVLDIDNKEACEANRKDERCKESLAYYRYLEKELETLKPLL
jgi:hypothetical protein